MDRNAIRAEIERLVDTGNLLFRREIVAMAKGDDRKKVLAYLNNDPEKEQLLKKPNFGREYQLWYSPALRVVEQLLPDRYIEFRNLYMVDRRKTLNFDTYGIGDYIVGIRPGMMSPESALDRALSSFRRQVDIVDTAEGRLDSVLTDIGRTLRTEILDDELDAARNLLAAAHVRSAGVVAGVVLEGHLKKLIVDHKVPFRKKAMLSNLNDALKGAEIYDATQWRQIQYLTDIRNLCGHKGDRNPEPVQVEALITEVAKIVKNLF